MTPPETGSGAATNGDIRTTAFGARLHCRFTDVIQRRIMLFGLWEPHVSAVIRELVGPGDTAIDVGANIGYHSLLLAWAVGPTGRVVAIEPNPEIIGALRDNLALNRSDQVRVVEAAVGSEKRTATLYEMRPDNCGMATLVAGPSARAIGTVRTAPLHDLLTAEEIASAILFKIDVERSEQAVAEAILDRLPDFRSLRHVLIELGCDGRHRLFDRFRAAGFAARHVRNDYSLREYRDFSGVGESVPIECLPKHQIDVLFSR